MSCHDRISSVPSGKFLDNSGRPLTLTFDAFAVLESSLILKLMLHIPRQIRQINHTHTHARTHQIAYYGHLIVVPNAYGIAET